MHWSFCCRSRLACLTLCAALVCAAGLPACAQLPSDIPHGLKPLPSLIPGITLEGMPLISGSTSAEPLGAMVFSRICGLEGDLAKIGWYNPAPEVVFPLDISHTHVSFYSAWRFKARHEGTYQSYLALITSAAVRESAAAAPAEPFATLGPVESPGVPEMIATPAEPSPGSARPPILSSSPADVILVARPPSEEELKAAAERGVELDVRPVALDAFVFLVNDANPVKSLTMEQIRDIFADKVANWKDVGGKDQPLNAYSRDRNSGSRELMDELVMKGLEHSIKDESILMGMGGPIDKISTEDNAIAYSVYYYERYMNHDPRNRLLAVNGILPTAETIASRRYPLTTEVYVVTLKGIPEDDPAAILRDWLLSEEGQKLVERTHYVPIRKPKN